MINSMARLASMSMPCTRAGILITHEGATFAPVISVRTGGSYHTAIYWSFPDGTHSIDRAPEKDFGSPGTRQTLLQVTPWENLIALSVGYTGADAGGGYPYHDLLLPLRAGQNVSAIDGLSSYGSGLIAFAACDNEELTSLVVDNMSGLVRLDAYDSGLTSVQLGSVAAPMSALGRLTLESCHLSSIDLTHCPQLGDFRCAGNRAVGGGPGLTAITLPPTNPSPLYHWCTHSNYLVEGVIPRVLSSSPLINLIDLYLNNDGGAAGTGVYDFRNHDHLRNLRVYANPGITQVLIDGTPTLNNLQAQECTGLTQAEIDYLLVTIESFGTTADAASLVNLLGCAAPSATGVAAATALQGRGWPVLYET